MPRRPNAKQLANAHERFKTALTNYIVSKGARPGESYDFELDTPAGRLCLTVYDNWIATRFDDVAEGRRFTASCGVGCNPFSGKWNFHYCDDLTSLDPDVVIADFGYYLDRLLKWNSAAGVTGVFGASPTTRNK